MTEIIRQLADLSGRYDALYCDLWGCLHNGIAPFPAAVAALQGFRAAGGKVILLTNAPRPKSSVAKQLAGMGLPADAWDDIATSGDAAQYAMLTGAVGENVYFIGAPKDEPFFTDFSDDLRDIARVSRVRRVPLDQAQGIVCTGLADDMTETPDDYRAPLLMGIAKGLPMLCANPDIIVDLGERRMFCAGALAQAYEEMGGTVLYFGKPHPPVYDVARRRLNLDDPRILAVGDGILTDIQGAMGEGIDSLFVTGGIAAAEFGADPANPDPAKLNPWLEKQMLSPTFAIGQLR